MLRKEERKSRVEKLSRVNHISVSVNGARDDAPHDDSPINVEHIEEHEEDCGEEADEDDGEEADEGEEDEEEEEDDEEDVEDDMLNDVGSEGVTSDEEEVLPIATKKKR